MEGNSSSSTESDDVTAAGQCDVIARSSSSEKIQVSSQESGMFEWIRGGKAARTMLQTDDVNSIASATPSEEERRQRRERRPRSVTG